MALETDRLTLRPVERTDSDAWAMFLSDADALRLVHFRTSASRTSRR